MQLVLGVQKMYVQRCLVAAGDESEAYLNAVDVQMQLVLGMQKM